MEHTGGEKFDGYIEWLDYLVEHFFLPWGIKIDGSVRYQGDVLIDSGTIEIIDNRIEVRPDIYPRTCPKGAKLCQIDLNHIFRVIHSSKAGMLIYSRYWDSIWLPNNLVDMRMSDSGKRSPNFGLSRIA